jgi:hypothetical protein
MNYPYKIKVEIILRAFKNWKLISALIYFVQIFLQHSK